MNLKYFTTVFVHLVVNVVFIAAGDCIFEQTINYNRSIIRQSCPGFGSEWILFPDGEENPHVVHLKHPADLNSAKLFDVPNMAENVRFFLYTRQNAEGVQVNATEESLSNTPFDPSKPIKVVTHGFRSGGETETCQSIKDGFLEKYDANVFIVDWGDIAGDPYWNAARYPQYVGNYTADFLSFLVSKGANARDMHIVGHSLGAHLSGFAGKGMVNRGNKIARVTGLDPAYPGFELLSTFTGGRLEPSDADFVDVIHTCGGALGLLDPVGHADFYPNGGTPVQPGCSVLNILETCSHGRSWRYFAESINSEIPFVGYPCATWVDYMENRDCEGGSAFMGDPAQPTTKGKFYLKTAEGYPFAEGFEFRFENQDV